LTEEKREGSYEIQFVLVRRGWREESGWPRMRGR